MQIGILLAGHTPPALPGNDAMFRGFLAGRGFDFTTYAVVDGAFPDSATAAAGWIITGSRHGAYDPLPWIPRLEALIREIAAARRPLVGACFGHQIIAQALGGTVEKAGTGWITGRQTYDWAGQETPLYAWHQDQVTVAPPGARLVARGPGCPIAALAYDLPILTVQPHPEYDRAFMDLLYTHRGDVLPAAARAAGAATLGPPVAQSALADRFAATLTGQHGT